MFYSDRDTSEEIHDNRISRIALAVLALVLIIANIVRVNNGNLWLDEICSVGFAKLSIPDMISWTASDYNPPLYYFILKFMICVFGDAPWVYRLTTVIAYAGIMALCATVVYRNFGRKVAVIIMILATFLTTSMDYSVEIRSYEFAAFFILAAYLSMYYVLKYNRKIDYVWLIITSLCGAYTHYYCIPVVGLIYLTLLVYFKIVKDRPMKVLIYSIIFTVIGYLPWVLALLDSFRRINDGSFWLRSVISFKEAMDYLFYSDHGIAMTAIVFILVIAALVMKSKVWDKDSKKISAKIRSMDNETVWIIAGVMCVLGTILLGYLVSALIRPVIMLRYLYPLAIIAWILFAICAVRVFSMKDFGKHLVTVIIVCLLLIGVPNYFLITDSDNAKWDSTQNILNVTNDAMSEGSIILTDNGHFIVEGVYTGNLQKYYYPDHQAIYIDPEIPSDLDHSKEYWLFLQCDISQTTYRQQLNEQGLNADSLLVSGSFADCYNLYVYKVI